MQTPRDQEKEMWWDDRLIGIALKRSRFRRCHSDQWSLIQTPLWSCWTWWLKIRFERVGEGRDDDRCSTGRRFDIEEIMVGVDPDVGSVVVKGVEIVVVERVVGLEEEVVVVVVVVDVEVIVDKDEEEKRDCFRWQRQLLDSRY